MRQKNADLFEILAIELYHPVLIFADNKTGVIAPRNLHEIFCEPLAMPRDVDHIVGQLPVPVIVE